MSSQVSPTHFFGKELKLRIVYTFKKKTNQYHYLLFTFE